MPDLKARLERMWVQGDLLRAIISGDSLFPLEMSLRRPTAREIADHFGAVIDWAEALRAGSRDASQADSGPGGLGSGYQLRWERINSRVHGANDLPVAAVFPTEGDALRFIRRQTEAKRAQELARVIAERHSALFEWIVRRPLVMLDYEAEWPRLLAVLDWFVAHPRTNLYLRQLDIPGVDTKFIEAHRGLLMELLDAVLPAEAVEHSATGVRNFAIRYGLRSESPLVRFRLLDPALYIQGMSDLSIPAEQFAQLEWRHDRAGERTSAAAPLERVFITENRINGLAFPEQARSLVIFGLGYGVERLAEVPWLREVEVCYWGDIDTHGFGILNRLRTVLPGVRSILMDRATLMAHQQLWGHEPENKRYGGDPTHLTPDEHALFDDLRHDRLGVRVRLEQERIGYGWVQRTLHGI